MAWENTTPCGSTSVCASVVNFTDNYKAIEAWTNVEHGCLSATTIGKHFPGKAAIAAIISGSTSHDASAYNLSAGGALSAAPSGSFAIMYDPLSGACAWVVKLSATDNWEIRGPSHLLLGDLTCADPHTQYIASHKTLSAAVSATACTITGTFTVNNLLSASGRIFVTDTPTATLHVVNKSFVDTLASAGYEATRSPSMTGQSKNVVVDTGIIALPQKESSAGQIEFTCTRTPQVMMLYLYQNFHVNHCANMTMHGYAFGPQLIGWNSTGASVTCQTNVVQINDANQNCSASNVSVRLVGIAPTGAACCASASGWITHGTAGTQAIWHHGLGTTPDLMLLEISSDDEGDGYKGYSMAGNYNWEADRTISIVSADSTHIVVSFGNDEIAGFYDIYETPHVPVVADNWYYQLRAYYWTPDYTSEWIFVRTDSGMNEVMFNHNLHCIPYMYVVEFMDASSADFVYIMGSIPAYSTTLTFGYATTMQVWEDWATVKVGKTAIAVYEDAAGTNQLRTSGYIRFKAWCT